MRKLDRDTAKEHYENWFYNNLAPELEPCPFCGNTNVVFVVDNKYGEPEIIEYSVVRDDYIAVLCKAYHGGCGAMSGYGFGFEEAVKKWHSRAKKLRKDK